MKKYKDKIAKQLIEDYKNENNTKKLNVLVGLYLIKNEVAIVNQNHDSWSLPKGHIDEGETPIDAAIREIYEETGIINPKLVKKLGIMIDTV